MKALKTSIRPIGNSRGVVIPKPMLVQAGLTDEAEISVEGGAIVLRRPASRAGWAEASRRVAEADDDVLVMGEFGNADDTDHTW
ncbi:MAG TPA: AbrB/MazE/SpoVT family DNA-binding domain-containing protein [Patescibacteria group bacterium]|nr:AbrB/MazE/SpoVT family DNA-binding domain-containing protein [Patescibacteria group bacterium]